ncbi:MAG: OmcA/MtrC family decaheme c-type cytochrome, partial [Acidobacteria bacterium]|nr:OmcA/MtrC family decaheme c-type cytochrome [Acidobacteriota bacterium]
GARQKTELCILCHQPQTTDPDTGNTEDFKVMIHKIHRGASLPSVLAGTPYQIIGFNQTVFNFGEIHWPQDTRNCTTCHQQGTQSDNYKTNPSRVACGSCHDDVNFATGEHHPGGVQTDDSKCSICHASNTGLEFDLSVDGIHTIPGFSKKLAGVNVKILEVTNTKPGDKPTVSFTVSDDAGKPIALTSLASLSLRLAGPTTDYTWTASENALTATATSTGYAFTFRTNGLPANASGSYAVSAEAARTVTLAGSLLGQSFSVSERAYNPVFYFGVGGSKIAPRREVVDVKNCNTCHKRLALHGGGRLNPNYCVMCHNPATGDDPEGARAAGRIVPAGLPKTSINFRFMIHRIHTGHDLENDYTVYRSRGIFNFNEIHFPGDRRNCAKCHINNSQLLPLPASMANTLATREFYSPLGPAASACLGCHDSQAAAAHAFLQTAPFGESCAACHGEGKELSVSRVHAR